MSLAQDFKQWVAEQNPQQTINHDSWYACAIGLYAGSRPGEITVGDVLSAINKEYGHPAYMFIGNGGASSGSYKTQWDHMTINTMGELSAWLHQLNSQGV